MIEAKVKIVWTPEPLKRAVRRGNTAALRRSAAYLRKVAQNRIKSRKNYDTAAAPGGSPHTHGNGKFFKNSILFAVEGNAAYIGPAAFPGVGGRRQIIGAIHEFGGTVKPAVGNGRKRKAADWNNAKAGPVRIEKGVLIFGRLNSRRQRKRAARLAASGAKLKAKNAKQRKSAKLMRLEMAEKKGTPFHYPARPTMGPALKAAEPHIAKFWENVVSG
ncbi:MAG: hypothetical protein ACI4UV_09120 [Victivallales bacterium]